MKSAAPSMAMTSEDASAGSPRTPLDHPLLASAGCPATGGGAIGYLKYLIRGLEAGGQLGLASTLPAWLTEARDLLGALSESGAAKSLSPTGRDLESPLWKATHGCIDSRRSVAGRSTSAADAIFSLIVLDAAAAGARVHEGLMLGLKNCYTALGGRRALHPEWSTVVSTGLLSTKSLKALLPGLSHPPAKAFVVSLIGLVDKPAPDPSAIAKPALPISDAHAPTSLEPDVALVDEDRDDQGSAQISKDEPAVRELLSTFKLGDSVLEWQRRRAVFMRRNDRLSLPSWEALPTELTCQIAARLQTIIQDLESPDMGAAVLALASLLTSTPSRILLHADLDTTEDLRINLPQGCFTWSLEGLRAEPMQPPVSASVAGNFIQIPFPPGLGRALAHLRSNRVVAAPRYFSDLFHVAPDTAPWRGLLLRTHDLLLRLGDPAFPAFLTRWSNSISRVYLQECGSDLLAAVSSLDMGIAAPGAPHYFHPNPRSVEALSQRVQARLGLGNAMCSLMAECETTTDLPSDDELRRGFTAMCDSISSSHRAVSRARTPDEAVPHFNELVRHVASALVFCIGGRGSRIDEVTCGAALISPSMIWIEDKKVREDVSSRLVPKVPFLDELLRSFAGAQQALAARIVPTLRRHAGDVWRELAAGDIRFDAVLLQQVIVKDGVFEREPVLPAAIEEIARKHFGRPKNFMRHILITTWSMAGRDPDLLRLVTGHAHTGLEVPAAGSVYSPLSAIRAAGEILQELLGRWLPSSATGVTARARPRFKRLPGRRIRQVERAHRESLERGGAPSYSRWHFAAEAIVRRIRSLLLHGGGPDSAPARLWLHLLVFDGLHEDKDLRCILGDLDASLIPGRVGWVVGFRAADATSLHLMPLQMPTQILIGMSFSEKTQRTTVDYEEALCQVNAWLSTAMPDCWEADEKAPAKCLVAATALWLDVAIPSSLQFCYSESSHAPVLDEHSARRLFGLERGASRPALPAVRRSHAQADGLLSGFFRQINRLGNNSERLGELKKRASLFDGYVSSLDCAHEGHFAELLIQVVQRNNELIRSGKKNRIEFSSQSTYFSNLRPFLIDASIIKPTEMNDLDWRAFARALLAFANDKESDTNSRLEAARWLLTSFREIGYPVEPEPAEGARKRRLLPAKSTPIALVTSADIEAARELLLCWAGGVELDEHRAMLALDLLGKLPLRWREVASLSISDIHCHLDALCIQPSGFSHIKSLSSKRWLAISRPLREQLDSMSARLSNQGTQSGVCNYFFVRAKGDVVDASSADAIHESIGTALIHVTGNPNFRVHALRASRLCELAYPGWADLARSIGDGSIGPVLSEQYFQYSASHGRRMDRARVAAGHARVDTTLAYYIYCWLPMRAAAMHSTLTHEKPTDWMLDMQGVTRHALEKHRARHPEQSDPWLFIHKRLGTQRASRSQRPGPSDENPGANPAASPVASAQDSKAVHEQVTILVAGDVAADIKYLSLRLLGIERQEAVDTLAIRRRHADDVLEPLLASAPFDASQLRGRIKGDISGRALRADKRQLLAASADQFLEVVMTLPTPGPEALLALLLPGRASMEWPEALKALAPSFAGSQFRLEVVSDLRRNDPKFNHQLAQCSGILVGNPCHDVGHVPRVFVVPADMQARNLVVKARLTTMARVVCCAHRLWSSARAIAGGASEVTY